MDLTNVVTNLLIERHNNLFQQQMKEKLTKVKKLEDEKKNIQTKISQLETTHSDAQAIIAAAYIGQLNQIKNELQNQSVEQTATTIESPATLPQNKIAPKNKQNILIAGILGIFIGILWAFGAEYFSKDKK